MTWVDFSLRLGVALFLGGAIGIERQWRQTKAILKTNVLVCMGSCMFVMMSVMTPGDSSPTRMAAQVVSGIGFLGGGIILRDGASIRGLNTAATLWCAAAVGTLTGGGYLFQAYVGSGAVVFANLILRPLAEQIKFQPQKNAKVNTYYRYSLICDRQDEGAIRDLVLHLISGKSLLLNSIQSQGMQFSDKPDQVALEIEVVATRRDDKLIERLAQQLQNKTKTHDFNWETIPGSTVNPTSIEED
jgi:putative Mg2+ transporter-C (MgtC) family protein